MAKYDVVVVGAGNAAFCAAQAAAEKGAKVLMKAQVTHHHLFDTAIGECGVAWRRRRSLAQTCCS